MEKYYVSTLLVSSLLIYLALVTTAHFTSLGSPFSLGLGTVALFSLPFTIMYFLKRAFSLYRVTDCPYCRYHEEQKLGRSFSG